MAYYTSKSFGEESIHLYYSNPDVMTLGLPRSMNLFLYDIHKLCIYISILGASSGYYSIIM
jgi:hypothetical protein